MPIVECRTDATWAGAIPVLHAVASNGDPPNLQETARARRAIAGLACFCILPILTQRPPAPRRLHIPACFAALAVEPL